MVDLIVLTPILLLLILIGIGVPISFALFISGILGVFFFVGINSLIGTLTTSPRVATASYLYTTIPMFLLMAELLGKSGMLSVIFRTLDKWTRQIPGGMAIATTFANGGMAALSGSSTASAATMARIAIPEMRKYGYDDRLSMGTVCAAGTFAIMIPPSIGLIIYGVVTETSIAQLFLAGVVPGILTLISYVVLIMLWVKRNPDIAGGRTEMDPAPWKERFRSLLPVWPAIVLIALILGGLYSGAVTATEAGALGAFGSLVIGVGVYGMGWEDINSALTSTIEVTTMIFMILIGALVFGFYLTTTRITQEVVLYVSELPIGRWPIFLIIVLIYLLLGMLMNQSAILILTLPVTFPLVVDGLGFHPIWFGIIIAKTAEIGMITPPLGLNVYVASSAVDVDSTTGFRGSFWFLLADAFILILLMLFPSIVTYLPGTM